MWKESNTVTFLEFLESVRSISSKTYVTRLFHSHYILPLRSTPQVLNIEHNSNYYRIQSDLFTTKKGAD